MIDDNPLEEDSDGDSEGSNIGGPVKRKKSDDEDDELDDRLEDEDYDLIEENLGVKVERVRFSAKKFEFFLKKLSFLETLQASQENHRRGLGQRGNER